MTALAIATQKSDWLSAFFSKMSQGSCVCVPNIPAFSADLVRLREQNVALRQLATSRGGSTVLSQFNAGGLLASGSPQALTADFPGLAMVAEWDVPTSELATVLTEWAPSAGSTAFVDTPGQTSRLVNDLMRWAEGAFGEIHFVLAAEPLFSDELSLAALDENAEKIGYQIQRLDINALIHGHYCIARFNGKAALLQKELIKAELDLENLRDRYEAQSADYQKALEQLESAVKVYEKLVNAPPDVLKALGIRP